MQNCAKSEIKLSTTLLNDYFVVGSEVLTGVVKKEFHLLGYNSR
jgi:hypothetical protein